MLELGIFMVSFGVFFIIVGLTNKFFKGEAPFNTNRQFSLNNTIKKDLETYSDDRSRQEINNTIEAMNAN